MQDIIDLLVDTIGKENQLLLSALNSEVFYWYTSEYEQCPAACSVNVQYRKRDVRCVDTKGYTVSDEKCNDEVPTSSRVCPVNQCECRCVHGTPDVGADCPIDDFHSCASCDIGYRLIGNRCSPVSCQALHVPNGEVSFSNSVGEFRVLEHGSRASYSCRSGFQLVGFSSLECIDGNWNESPPLCEED